MKLKFGVLVLWCNFKVKMYCWTIKHPTSVTDLSPKCLITAFVGPKMCLYWPIYWYWYCHQPKNLAFLLTYLMIFLFVLSHCLVPLPLLRYILDMNSVSHYTPAQWPPGIYVMGKRPDVQVCICNHKCPTFNHIHQLTSFVTRLN